MPIGQNHVSGFGFARRGNGDTLFVHRKNLRGWPKVRSVEPGSTIEFEVVPAAVPGGKPMAVDVEIIETPKRDASRYLPGEKPGPAMIEERYKATLR